MSEKVQKTWGLLPSEQSYILHAWKRSDLVAQIAATMIPDEEWCPDVRRVYLRRASRLLEESERMENEREGRGE